MNEIKRLARNECATFDRNTHNECLLVTAEDGSTTCTYFRAEGGRCGYFEASVLPAHSDLIAEYRATRTRAKRQRRRAAE